MSHNKIHIYLRQTANNKVSTTRVSWFNYEKAFKNLLDTINPDLVNLTVVFDGNKEEYNSHFTKKYENYIPFRVKLINTKSYTEKSYQNDGSSKSYCLVSQIIKQDNLPEESLIGVFENDYIYQNIDWATIVLDLYNNFVSENTYVSLYEHKDTYLFQLSEEQIKQNHLESHWGLYRNLESKIFISNFWRWRVLPLITSTWIFSKSSFNRDIDLHSIGMSDNTLSGEIKKRGSYCVSPIPSINTHSESWFLSPFINWEKILDNTVLI